MLMTIERRTGFEPVPGKMVADTCMAAKYAPKSLGDIVGQPKACAVASRFIGRGGHAFFVTGASGTGKTSLANVLALAVASPECVMTVDSPRELAKEDLLNIKDAMQSYGFGRGGRALIINEAHGLAQWQIEILLGMIDSCRIPSHCVVIFTTTKEGEESIQDKSIDSGPLLSRCKRIALTNQGLSKAFAEVVHRNAMAEGLLAESATVEDVAKLVVKCKNNLRAVYSEVESGALL
jgi:replication-associated recombination protein RarA